MVSDSEFTSARLRQALQDLAASQADLTAAITGRDTALVWWRKCCAQRKEIITDAELVRAELASARAELVKLRTENDRLGQLMKQAAERANDLTESRRWQVARQDAGPCLMCGLPMVRSQAVKPVPGTTKGAWAHVECPDVKAFPWVVARDGGRDCVTCGHEIRRGEAYEYRGVDELAHIHCPTPTEETP